MASDPLKLLNFMGPKTLPLIRQNEVAECGNACLAMVSGFYGFKTNISALRRRFPTSVRGMNLRTLAENAGRLGFSTRALKVEIGNLGKLRLPAIIHWDLNHFVVLKSFSRGKAVIHDPAKGAYRMSVDELSTHYTGIALELTPTGAFEKDDERVRLRFSSLWSRISGLGSSLAQILLLSLVLQAYVLAAPQYLQMVIDTVLPTLDVNLLVTLALGFAMILVISIIASVIRSLIILYAGTSIAYQIATNLFAHMVRLPLPFFARRHIGDIVSRFSSIDPIKDFLTQGIVGGAVDGIMAVLTLALMFAYSPMLAMVSLVSLMLYLILRLGLFRALRRESEELIVTEATEDSNFMETVRGIQTIKAFALEKDRQSRWQNFLADATNQSVRVARLNIVFETATRLLQGLELVLLVFLAARMVMESDFTVGMIFAFMAYRLQFTDKATNLVELLIQFRMLDLHLERLADIANAEKEPEGGDRLRITQGRIELDQLSFAYEKHLPPILDGASAVIAPGECVAITGPSGCGKTTLLKIMMGLLQPDRGTVSIDGTALRQADAESYRRQIGSAMQDDTLFSGSLAENIAFFDDDLDMERVQDAARLACVDADITQMSMGYETPVGDMGSSLSGGQRQRLLLARALYQEPRILFLDEGTSHLDVATEKAVNEAVSTLGITRIVVAHRPQTIAMADRVLEIRDGALVEVTP